MLMGIIVWIVVGLIIGFAVGKMLDLHGDDPRFGIAASAVGALVAAGMYTMISGNPVYAWNMWGLLWAAIGGAVGTAAWHGIRSRFITHEPYSRRRSY
jgi:uncharacterized membrane protein YeaQ/YmgE (transglycosylase-associated protein family)